MKTRVITDRLEEAAEILCRGGLVAVPTETVYGLAGNGLDPAVIQKIYDVKGRPAVKPIALMVPGSEAIAALCPEAPPAAAVLAGRFWPGPLTLVLPARDTIPSLLRAGGTSVGLRCPRHEKTLGLLRLLEFPLAVPSANPSGLASPTTAEEVLAYFDGKIDAVLDGGPCSLGRASTVFDLTSVPYRVLREGSLTEEELADALVDALFLIGITGPSGCGKTTVLQVCAEFGALPLDLDQIYHRMLEENPKLPAAIEAAFPGTVRDGRLSRPALRDIVFRDPAAVALLDAVTHPFLLNEVQRLLRRHALSGGTHAAVDAVKLIESGLGDRCDLSLAVTAPAERRTERIMARDGLSRADAELRIAAQHPDSWYAGHCDAVIVNDSDLSSLRKKTENILKEKTKVETL
ncbi:MAG: threonylcarbamoyl-AMP synthase [Oscillospiraceae bacterium]|nr:threonylcarbamoyl-AMP synthase [Oscillospiraceae bacterium]